MTNHELWHTCTSPQQMVDWLGGIEANIERMTMFQVECRRIDGSYSEAPPAGDPRFIRGWLSGDNGLTLSSLCNILRCLFRNPLAEREKMACPTCKGAAYGIGAYYEICKACKGEGAIDAPIDPCWLSGDVRDLVRTIQGGSRTVRYEELDGVTELGVYDMPRFDLMPILGDALLDARCDDDEIIRHCQCGEHVAGCWVLDAIGEQHGKRTSSNSFAHATAYA